MEQQLAQGSKIILSGGTVAFPTETVYGLGANALDPKAVAKIFAVKERPSFDPLIVHIAELADLPPLVGNLSPQLWNSIKKLAEAFWPGPLTLVLPKSKSVPNLVTSGMDTVAIRIPAHPWAQAFIKKCGVPLAAPSANKFGKLSPTRAQHVTDHLPDVDFVIDGGPCSVGIESTIIQLSEEGFSLLRPGIITPAQISILLPELKREDISKQEQATKEGLLAHPLAPGMLKSHYAPSVPLYIMPWQGGISQAHPTAMHSLGEDLSSTFLQKSDTSPQHLWKPPLPFPLSEMGIISYSGKNSSGYRWVKVLPPDGNALDYAAMLFDALHEMQNSGAKALVAEAVPEEGIGVAIMDRLKKASFRTSSAE